MNNVAPDEQRNTEPALLDGDTLQLVNGGHVDLVDDRADPACAQRVAEHLHRIHVARMDLIHLADLFRQGHLPEQLGNAVFRACGITVNFCNGRGHGGTRQLAAEHDDAPRPDDPLSFPGAVRQYIPRRD